LVQTFNLKNFDINGKLEFETQEDKRKRMQTEYADDIKRLLGSTSS